MPSLGIAFPFPPRRTPSKSSASAQRFRGVFLLGGVFIECIVLIKNLTKLVTSARMCLNRTPLASNQHKLNIYRMKKNRNRGFTLLDFLIIMALIMILLGILISKVFGQTELRGFNHRLTYGLSEGKKVVYIGENWYYFCEPPQGSDIVSTVSSYMSGTRPTNSLMLTIICTVSKVDDDDVVWRIKKNLSKLVDQAGLTNGYFVALREVPNLHQQAEATR